jgi:hypothetical protein
MTGVMNLNLTLFVAKLFHATDRDSALMPRSAKYVPVILVKAAKEDPNVK